MLVYSITLQTKSKISLNHIDFCIKTLIPKIKKSKIFTSISANISESNRELTLNFECKSLKDFNDYQLKSDTPILDQFLHEMGKDVVYFERKLTKEIFMKKFI